MSLSFADIHSQLYEFFIHWSYLIIKCFSDEQVALASIQLCDTYLYYFLA